MHTCMLQACIQLCMHVASMHDRMHACMLHACTQSCMHVACPYPSMHACTETNLHQLRQISIVILPEMSIGRDEVEYVFIPSRGRLHFTRLQSSIHLNNNLRLLFIRIFISIIICIIYMDLHANTPPILPTANNNI